MKKLLIIIIAVSAFTGTDTIAAVNFSSDLLLADSRIVSRGTSKLYWNNECLTLYSNGKCVLTQGDSVRIEGTYRYTDGWVILNFYGNEISCKATLGSDGRIRSVSYNGHLYS